MRIPPDVVEVAEQCGFTFGRTNGPLQDWVLDGDYWVRKSPGLTEIYQVTDALATAAAAPDSEGEKE